MLAQEKGPETMRTLLDKIRPLVQQIKDLHAECRAQGIFTNDKDLLTCPHCNLMEDIAIDGILITDFSEELGRDTGLRFKKLKSGRYRCPNCSFVVAELGPDTDSQPVKKNKARKQLEKRKR